MNTYKHRLFFWLILIVGVGLRLYHVLTAPYAYANTDTCTIWLMARHILGGEFPLFFYGQYYLGPLEPLTVAFFFILFGIKASTLYLGTIFYSGLFIISSYFLGKELKDKNVGILMMLYSAFPPTYFFRESIYPVGYHIEILFLGNIIFILTLKIPNITHEIKKTIYYILLGLFAGIGFWTHYIILYYLAPVALYLLINGKWRDLLKNILPAVISFFLVGLPFWIFTFRYNFATFRFGSQPASPGEVMGFLNLFMQNINCMFDMGVGFNSSMGVFKLIILCVYAMSILYFVFSSFLKRFFFNKNSILIYFFIFMVLFFIGYRSRLYAGGGSYYLLPIFIFISTAIGYFGGFIISRIKYVGLCVMIIIILFNTKGILETISLYKNISRANKEEIYKKIGFMEENKIFRFQGNERYTRPIVFFSNERIIATAFSESEYYPYEDIIERSSGVAFEERWDWRSSIDNICMDYDSKWGLYYNFRPYPYRTKVIAHMNWHAFASSNAVIARYAFDRSYDNYWIGKDGKKTGMSFTIDMGKTYKICKIVMLNAHHRFNYPINCKIQVSLDGHEWVDAAYIESVQPLFWSGPRPYWHLVDGRVELFFKPVEARFVRLVQIGEDPENPREINEIFVYEYLGDEGYRERDYVKDAKGINSFCIKKKIDFIYADFWLSAKIIELSKSKIEALLPYNSYLPPRKNMSREVKLGKDRAFVIRKGDMEELEAILTEFELPFKKVSFRHYTCYYFPGLKEEYESMPSLMWIGIGLVKHSLRDYSKWLYKRGDYEKALGYDPNNFLAYLRCIEPLTQPAGAPVRSTGRGGEGEGGYLKCKTLPSTRFFPNIEKIISFENGIRFLGHSIRTKKLRPGNMVRIEYFWEVQKELDENLSVFVHFIKDGRIVFQNDHKFLYQFPRPLNPLEGERFREVLKPNIPKDIQPGICQILIGLWDERTGKRIYIKDPLNKRKSAQIIGDFMCKA